MPAAIVAVATFVADAVADIGATIGLSTLGATIGAAVGNGILALGFQAGLGAAIGAWATVASIAEVLLYKPNLKSAGSFQSFLADPQAAIFGVMGRYGTAGRAVYMTTSGGDNNHGAAGNAYLTSLVILSALGPIQAVESLKCNDTYITFAAQPSTPTGRVTGGTINAGTFTRYNTSYVVNSDGSAQNNIYAGKMWMTYQLGYDPSPVLEPTSGLKTGGPLTEWTTDKGLSSFAAAMWTLWFDSTVYAGSPPKPIWTLQGYKAYDPRQDSTYPGGAGSQRWADRSTWAYTTNPFVHALNWALGFWYPDPNNAGQVLLYAGIGAPASSIDVAAFVACANVADANGWQIGGAWSTDDDKFAVLANMLAAGSGLPVIGGGLISCIVNAPQTSLGTITADQLAGPISINTSASMRDRLNRIFPRFHAEAFGWQLVPYVEPITGETYVAEDQGRIRSKTIDYQFVTDANLNQPAQLAAYDIATSREGVVVTLQGKPILANYPVGAAVTLELPQAQLSGFLGIITKRQLDFGSGRVTLTVRSETTAKHAWALGQSGTAPPTPQIGGIDMAIVAAPLSGQWSAAPVAVTDAVTGEKTYVIRVTGSASDNVNAGQVVITYAQALTFDGSGNPLTYGDSSTRSFTADTTQMDLDVNAGVWLVQVYYVTQQGASGQDDCLDLGDITVPGSTAAGTAVATIGVNRVPYSQFESGTTGWTTSSTGSPTSVSTSVGTYDSQAVYWVTWSPAHVGDTASIISSAFPVTAGETLAVMAGVETNDSQATALLLNYYNSAGTLVSSSAVVPSIVNTGFGAQQEAFTTVPAGAVTARLQLKSTATATTGGQVFDLTRPMVCGANPGQNSFPAFNPGPNAQNGADVTSQNTAAAITGQGALATSGLSENQVNNALVPAIGVNRVPYSQFESGANVGWSLGTNSGGLTVTTAAPTVSGVPCRTLAATSTASGQNISHKSSLFPVTGGERLAVQGLMGLTGAWSGVCTVWFNSATVNGFAHQDVFTIAAGSAFPTPLGAFVTVPAGAVSAWVEYYATSTGSGQATTYTLAQPMVSGATSAQTVFPAFNPGPNAQNGADITSQNTAAAVTGQGSLATKSSVGTSDITANAVTTAGTAYTSGTLTVPSGTTTIQSVTATVTGGYVRVTFSGTLSGALGTDPSVTVNIYRGSTLLYSTYASGPPAGAFVTVVFGDTPGAGTYTYTAQMTNLVGTTTYASSRFLEIMEIKR